MLFKPAHDKGTGLLSEQRVEVVYAAVHKQRVVSVDLQPNMRVIDAIRQSGLLAEFPEISMAHNKVGIFGRKVSLELQLKAGDRVEIYRPLKCSPQEARRRRALNNH